MSAPSLPNDHVLAFVLLGLAVIVVVARLVGGLFVRVGQPRVVGEIVAGILLGPSVLGPAIFQWDNAPAGLACDRSLPEGGLASISSCLFPVQARSVLGIVGQLGLALFMFLVGLRFDPRTLRGRTTSIVATGVAGVLVPVGVGFAVAPMLFDSKFVAAFGTPDAPTELGFTLFVSALLSVTAFPVAVRILQEKGLVDTQMGASTIASAAIVTVLMFVLLGIARGAAADSPGSTHVARIIGVVAFLIVVGLALPLILARLVQPDISDGSLIALALVVCLGGAYAADRIGVNVILGGFVAGMAIPHREALAPRLEASLATLTVTVLLPVFLAVSGLNTDLTSLSGGALVGLAVLLVASVVSKFAVGLLVGRATGLTWSEGATVGALLNCRGLLVLVVALVGLQAGVISPQLQVGAVLVALVTTAMTGPLVDRLAPEPQPATAKA